MLSFQLFWKTGFTPVRGFYNNMTKLSFKGFVKALGSWTSLCVNFTGLFEQFSKIRTASNHQDEESAYLTDWAELTQNLYACWQTIMISTW